MSKLLITFLLCCLGVACAGAFDDNNNGNVKLGENLLVDHLLVKRDALPEAEKKNGGKGKTNGGKGRKGNKEKKRGRKAKKPNKSGRKAKKSKKSGRKAKKSKKSERNVKKPKKNGRKAKKPKKSGRKAKNPKESGRNAKKPKKSGGKAKKPKKSGRKAKKPKTHGKKAKKQKKGGRNAKKPKKGGRKAKKPKISGRKKPKNGIGRNNKAPRQTNFTSCVAKFIEYSRINELKATSIEKQVNRINSFKGIQDKKTGKKGDFEGTYNTLLSAMGGNESAPECDGKPINGSSRNAKYKGTLSTLKACEADIKKLCNYEINSTFNSTLQACLSAAKQFKKEFKVCFDAKKSSAEACTCVDTIDTANYKKLKACDTKNANDDIKIKKKACIKGFIVCKTAQDDSVDGVGSCKKVNRCGGAANKTEAERLLKILTPLKDALANPKFADALKKLGLNTGPGSDGKLPSTNTTRLNQLRLTRFAVDGRQSNTTDGKGCTDIAAEWNNFNTSGDKAVPGVDGDVDSTEVNNTVGSLNRINNRDNLETDLGSCAKEDSRQITVTFTIIRIRFYVFWCGWFQVFVVEIKITIITITFGLPPSPPPTPPSPPTIAPAPTPVATSAPGGGRHIVKQIMKRAAFSKK